MPTFTSPLSVNSHSLCTMRAKMAAIVFVCLAAGAGWVWLRPQPADLGTANPSRPTPSPSQTPAATPAPERPEPLIAARQKLSQNPATAKTDLDALARHLASLPRAEAVKFLLSELAKRSDAQTNLSFTIGAGGNLDSAPTFRVWMLDQLGRLEPAAAADYARQILATPENSDEWAVAMRDFARVKSSPEDAAFLKTKLRELLAEPRWQSGQSVGWFEAFDVAVYLRATDLAPDFARLLVKTDAASRPAAHAAFLTLDRLVLAAPAELLTRLQADPALMQGRELTRADYFARADLRDEAQRTVVEQYLLDPARTAQELTQFSGIYPNANRMISKNLLTPSDTPKGEDLAAHDRESLAIVRAWLDDPRFTPVRPTVEKMQARLAQFVKESAN